MAQKAALQNGVQKGDTGLKSGRMGSVQLTLKFLELQLSQNHCLIWNTASGNFRPNVFACLDIKAPVPCRPIGIRVYLLKISVTFDAPKTLSPLTFRPQSPLQKVLLL
jgi:hypothetical protein